MRQKFNFAAPTGTSSSNGGERAEEGLFNAANRSFLHVWRPSWDGKATTIRIYPYYDKETKQFHPYKYSPDENDWGNWLRIYPIVHRVGQPQRTFIAYDHQKIASEGYDPATHPYSILRSEIERSIKDGFIDESWGKIIATTKNGQVLDNRILPSINECGLVQVALYQHNDKSYALDPRGTHPQYPTVVMMLKNSSIWRMLKRFKEMNPDYAGDPFDYEAAHKYGDPVSLEHGRFVTFFQEGRNPGNALFQDFSAMAQQTGPRRAGFGSGGPKAASSRDGGGDDDSAAKRYDVRIDETFMGQSPVFDHAGDVISQVVRDWDDILTFPSHEKIIQMLADILPASALIFGLGNHPDYKDMIPEKVFDRAVNRTTVGVHPPRPVAGAPVPAGSPEGQQPVQHQQPVQPPVQPPVQHPVQHQHPVQQPVQHQRPVQPPVQQTVAPASPARSAFGRTAPAPAARVDPSVPQEDLQTRPARPSGRTFTGAQPTAPAEAPAAAAPPPPAAVPAAPAATGTPVPTPEQTAAAGDALQRAKDRAAKMRAAAPH